MKTKNILKIGVLSIILLINLIYMVFWQLLAICFLLS